MLKYNGNFPYSRIFQTEIKRILIKLTYLLRLTEAHVFVVDSDSVGNKKLVQPQ